MAEPRRRTSLDAWADRRVNDAHMSATRKPDPVAFLRDQQAGAERVYCATGGKRELALVRAFARSLDGDDDGC